MELSELLVKAKKTSYASGNKAKVLADGFEEFVYEEEGYKYRDRYYAKGPNPFGGEELVWYNGEVIWIMNFYGYLISNNIESEVVYAFLRKAMSLLTKERPFRGPSKFKEGKFEYRDENEGDIGSFRGTEKIYFKGKEVYRLHYHGGLLGQV